MGRRVVSAMDQKVAGGVFPRPMPHGEFRSAAVSAGLL